MTGPLFDAETAPDAIWLRRRITTACRRRKCRFVTFDEALQFLMARWPGLGKERAQTITLAAVKSFERSEREHD